MKCFKPQDYGTTDHSRLDESLGDSPDCGAKSSSKCSQRSPVYRTSEFVALPWLNREYDWRESTLFLTRPD